MGENCGKEFTPAMKEELDALFVYQLMKNKEFSDEERELALYTIYLFSDTLAKDWYNSSLNTLFKYEIDMGDAKQLAEPMPTLEPSPTKGLRRNGREMYQERDHQGDPIRLGLTTRSRRT